MEVRNLWGDDERVYRISELVRSKAQDPEEAARMLGALIERLAVSKVLTLDQVSVIVGGELERYTGR